MTDNPILPADDIPGPEYKLLVASLVAMRNLEPYVTIEFEGPRNKIQMTVAEARAHAQLVIEAAEAALQDAFIIQFGKGKVGLELGQAATLLSEFRAYREKKAL